MPILLLCSSVSCGVSEISIEDISSKKVGKTVYLTGEVVHLAPLLDRTAYQLEDDTGTAWIITSTEPPERGQEIYIKGKVEHKSLPFERQELGSFYAIELERLDPEEIR